MEVVLEPVRPEEKKGAINSLKEADLPIHGWYRFVLSFPPHLVRQYLDAFGLGRSDLVFDPFCGTGTTLVEAKKWQVPSVGCDAHPFAALVSRVKTNWEVSSTTLRPFFRRILRAAEEAGSAMSLRSPGMESLLFQEGEDRYSLTEDEERILPTGFLSNRPLKRLLVLRDSIEKACRGEAGAIRDFFLVCFGHVIANGAGNFAFGPEIYRTKAKDDYDALGHFALQGERMLQDLDFVRKELNADVRSSVYLDDARKIESAPGGISAVITSPPYPNEKDYTRTTRVESILLRLVTDRASLRDVKESLLRSNTRNVFVADKDGDEVSEFSSIQKVCCDIERRRVELKKDSGFEKLYHKVVAHYFGGMRQHLRALRPKLRKNAQLAYVVGDQLSFLMVPVATATLLSEVAAAEGYKTVRIDLWRERVGTKVRNSLDDRKTVRVREEILILKNA